MVIPPAIGSADCLHAWVLRGWVDAGVPDATLGGVVPEGGSFSAENVRRNGGVEGLELVFPGFDAGEEWNYAVVVAGASVHVCCGDTLFSHAYAGIPPQQLGARIVADVRAHNQAFVAWRTGGGVVGLAETRAIRPPRGQAASRGLIDLLERRYRGGHTLASGPAEGWWIEANAARALGGAIRSGQGLDPTFRLGAQGPMIERPEYREYAAKMRTLGSVVMGVGVGGLVVGGLGLAWAGFNVSKQRWDVILTRDGPGIPLLIFVGALVFAGSMFTAGLRMRALRNLMLVRVLLAHPRGGLGSGALSEVRFDAVGLLFRKWYGRRRRVDETDAGRQRCRPG